MKKGYRIIFNGELYKVQRFCSFLKGIFKFKKTYNSSYLNKHDAETKISFIKEERKNIKKARKFYKEAKKKPWKTVETFLD